MTAPARLTPPAEVRAAVDARLSEFLDAARARFAEISPVAERLLDPIARFASGGKRVRGMLLWWGYELAGGEDRAAIASAAASVELLHAAALIHDDIIDASETRRGAPAVHAEFRDNHRARGFAGDAELYGTGVGIVAGDLCLSLSEEVFSSTGFTQTPAVIAARDDLRRDVMVGQFFDIEIQAAPVAASELADRADEVLVYKSAKYTVEQPLLVGAALAEASDELSAALSDFGIHLGRAFQLRDDELGVFGDPALTGKPVGDDFVQGKRTVLVADVLTRVDSDRAAWFSDRLDDPTVSAAEVEEMVALTRSSGARDAFENRIVAAGDDALAALRRLGELGVSAADLSVLDSYARTLIHRTA